MEEEYPRPVKTFDGKTYIDKDGKEWKQRFKTVCYFKGDSAAVQLKDGSWTIIDKNGKLWEQSFKSLLHFNDGLAAVELEDGSWTFNDKSGKLCDQSFQTVYRVFEDSALVMLEDGDDALVDINGKPIGQKFKYVEYTFEDSALVMLEDGNFTFIDKNGKPFGQKFKFIGDYDEDGIAVELEDGTWTFVDDNAKLWEQRFKETSSFVEGLALVQLFDGKWTYIDKNGKLWDQRFDEADIFDYHGGGSVVCIDGISIGINRKGEPKGSKFQEGLAKAEDFEHEGRFFYVNKEFKIIPDDYVEILRCIYNKPETFLNIPTERFNDRKFIGLAITQIKTKLIDMVDGKKEIDDDYIKYSTELLSSIKEKNKKEMTLIKNGDKREKDPLAFIKDFNL